jgi:hypothetical protein
VADRILLRSRGVIRLGSDACQDAKHQYELNGSPYTHVQILLPDSRRRGRQCFRFLILFDVSGLEWFTGQ